MNSRNLNDAQIMKRVCDGQHQLFDELVMRYREPLLRAAWSKLGDRSWAEDVVQEALLAAFAARETYNPDFAFRTWIWTILLNLCRRQLKRRSKSPRELVRSSLQRSSESRLPELASYETGLTQALQTERQEQLMELLDELPEPQADALRLRFFGELKFHEIAQTMGCSLNGAKKRVRIGLWKLSQRLSDPEEESR